VIKYTLDTNIYINAFRDTNERAQLARFEVAYTPTLYLTSIVVHELHAGARTSDVADRLTKQIVLPFPQRRRVATPGYNEWLDAGMLRSRLASHGRPNLSASFLNDIMLAATCRTHDLILITRNTVGFSAIRTVFPHFRFETSLP
jgi:predicted nucleic acid-binding protein